MGQRINPIIFRLELKNNLWKTKYFGKTAEEIGFYNYKSLQIKNYLKIFFNRAGLMFHDYKLEYGFSTVKLFISYYLKLKLDFFFENNKAKKMKLKKSKKDILNNSYKICLFKDLKNNQLLKKGNFLQQVLEILSFSTIRSSTVLVKLQNLNKNLFFKLTSKEQMDLKKKVFLLRKFAKNKFFKEVINTVFLGIRFKNSAGLISNVIANILKKIKKHNFFFIFLKHILFLFLKAPFSKINGIKINVKGKLNNLPRAKNKIISTGLCSMQSLISSVSYYEKTVIITNGSLTVKTWVNQK